MEHPISYAMRNAEAVQSWVFFSAPSSLLDWSFSTIEAMVYVCAALGLWHALRSRQHTGQPAALYTFIACFLYGLLIDIISYYTVNNFWHGEFSVMFLHNRLPLYIALFYPAFMYPVFMTIKRYAFGTWTAAISTGFLAGLAYLIFDNLGPLLGWWIWDRDNPSTWPLLDSVPLTSYHWMFVFTTAFAFFAQRFFLDIRRTCCPRAKLRQSRHPTAQHSVFNLLAGYGVFCALQHLGLSLEPRQRRVFSCPGLWRRSPVVYPELSPTH